MAVLDCFISQSIALLYHRLSSRLSIGMMFRGWLGGSVDAGKIHGNSVDSILRLFSVLRPSQISVISMPLWQFPLPSMLQGRYAMNAGDHDGRFAKLRYLTLRGIQIKMVW